MPKVQVLSDISNLISIRYWRPLPDRILERSVVDFGVHNAIEALVLHDEVVVDISNLRSPGEFLSPFGELADAIVPVSFNEPRLVQGEAYYSDVVVPFLTSPKFEVSLKRFLRRFPPAEMPDPAVEENFLTVPESEGKPHFPGYTYLEHLYRDIYTGSPTDLYSGLKAVGQSELLEHLGTLDYRFFFRTFERAYRYSIASETQGLPLLVSPMKSFFFESQDTISRKTWKHLEKLLQDRQYDRLSTWFGVSLPEIRIPFLAREVAGMVEDSGLTPISAIARLRNTKFAAGFREEMRTLAHLINRGEYGALHKVVLRLEEMLSTWGSPSAVVPGSVKRTLSLTLPFVGGLGTNVDLPSRKIKKEPGDRIAAFAYSMSGYEKIVDVSKAAVDAILNK